MTLSDDNFLDKKKYSFVVYMVYSYKIYQLNVTLTFSRTGPISHDLKLIAAFLMKTCVFFHGTYSQSEQQPSFRGIPDDHFQNQSGSYILISLIEIFYGFGG